jgi:hypothetical protein
MDVEPTGEDMVVEMCVHIEDPTFDATAVATNPRARIRPIHRPPRVPSDRVPHCHWTLTIDETVDPIVQDPLTTTVGELPIASVENERPEDSEPGGRRDYSGAFDPAFTLEELSQGALVAVLREFTIQTQLLSASAYLHLSARFDGDAVHDAQTDQLAGASWVASERIARVLGVPGDGLDAALAVLAVHPAFPPGIDVVLERSGDSSATLRLDSPTGLLEGAPPGWLGLFAQDELRPIAAIVHAVEPRAEVTASETHGFSIVVDPTADPVPEPDAVGLTRISTAAAWEFRDGTPVTIGR